MGHVGDFRWHSFGTLVWRILWNVSLSVVPFRWYVLGKIPYIMRSQQTQIYWISYISGDQRTENNKLLTHFT